MSLCNDQRPVPESARPRAQQVSNAKTPCVSIHLAPLGPSPYSTRLQATEIRVDEFVEAYEILIITFDRSACRPDRGLR